MAYEMVDGGNPCNRGGGEGVRASGDGKAEREDVTFGRSKVAVCSVLTGSHQESGRV